MTDAGNERSAGRQTERENERSTDRQIDRQAGSGRWGFKRSLR